MLALVEKKKKTAPTTHRRPEDLSQTSDLKKDNNTSDMYTQDFTFPLAMLHVYCLLVRAKQRQWVQNRQPEHTEGRNTRVAFGGLK